MKGVHIALLMVAVLASACQAGVAVVGGLSRASTASPGEDLEHEIVLRNTGDFDMVIRLYPADYLFFADGRSIYGEPGSVERSNAHWFTLSSEWVTVPARSEATVYYRGRIPSGEALTGTYWSMLMVEPMGPAGAEELRDQEGRPGISVSTQVRYAVQIITDIGSTGRPDLRFLDRKLLTDNGTVMLQVDVENAGDRWVYPITWLEIYDDTGAFIGRVESIQKRIFPGCSVRHEFDLSGVSGGKYTALVIIDNTDEHVFGAQYKLEIES